MVATVSQGSSEIISLLVWPLALGLMLEAIGLIAHGRYLKQRGEEATASAQEQATTFGNSYGLRNLLLGSGLALTLAQAVTGVGAGLEWVLWGLTGLLVLSSAILGRALFYVVVIPTTMPGAFFWRNRGFQAHARESGLAEMPQVGVTPQVDYPELHRKRAVDEVRVDISKLLGRGGKPKEVLGSQVACSKA